MSQLNRYFIQKPTKTRKTYVLSCYVLESRTKKKYLPLPHEMKCQVDKINESFVAGIYQAHESELLLKQVIESAYRAANLHDQAIKQTILSDINQKILKAYWAKEYSGRYLEDEASPRYDLQKAIRLVEPLSMQIASAADLQKQLKASGVTVNEIRRATDRINQILRFLDRGFTLKKPKPIYAPVSYLSLAHFEFVLNHFDDPVSRDFAVALFGSGVRKAEGLALTTADLRAQQLTVNKQLTKSGVTKLPKREKTGVSVVLPFGVEALERWLRVENKEFYRYRIYDDLLRACMRAFPNDDSKWISPHDLRHSHAIHLLSCGASLTQVAFNLRNTVDVCQKYYTGFAHTDATADALKRIVG